jgi:hypothetical protein
MTQLWYHVGEGVGSVMKETKKNQIVEEGIKISKKKGGF